MSTAEQLAALSARLRNGGWDLRSPQELADIIAAHIDAISQSKASPSEPAATGRVLSEEQRSEIAQEAATKFNWFSDFPEAIDFVIDSVLRGVGAPTGSATPTGGEHA